MSDQAALLSQIVSLPELEERARRCMSSMAYDYVASGAADEITVKRNREAFNRIALWPRVLTGIDAPDTSVSIFGATAVLIGGPYCYGLSLRRAGGVRRCVEILTKESEMALVLSEHGSVREVDRSVISTPPA